MMKLSAKIIGKQLDLSPKEINELLQKSGYLTGKPRNWSATSIAEGLFELRQNTDGYGWCAKRAWSFLMWDERLVS